MADNMNVIRRLQILMETQGFDQAARTIGQAADALDDGAQSAGKFAQAMTVVATEQAKAADGAASSARKFALAQNANIEGLKELRRLGADFAKTLDFSKQFGGLEANAAQIKQMFGALESAYKKLEASGKIDALLPPEQLAQVRAQRLKAAIESVGRADVEWAKRRMDAAQALVRVENGTTGPALKGGASYSALDKLMRPTQAVIDDLEDKSRKAIAALTAAESKAATQGTGRSDRNVATYSALEAAGKKAEKIVEDEAKARIKAAQEITQALAAQRDAYRAANPPDSHVQTFKQVKQAADDVTNALARQRQAFRDANPPDEHVKAFKLARQAAQEEAEAVARVNAELREQSNARIQAQMAVIGPRSRSARDDGAGFEALKAQEDEKTRLAALTRQVRSEIDAEALAYEILAERIKDYDKALAMGEMSQTVHARATALAREKMDHLERSFAKNGQTYNVASRQLLNFSYQLNDVVTMAAMGANPFQILASQAGQFVQILQEIGIRNGGFAGGMKAMGAELLKLAVSWKGLAAAIGLGAGAGAIATYKYAESLKSLENSMNGVGRATGATVSELVGLSRGIAESADMSKASARALLATFSSSGKIAKDVFAEAAVGAQNLAAVTGKSVDEAGKMLADWLNDTPKGAAALKDSVGGVNDAWVRNIELMAKAGNTSGAQREIVKALIENTKDYGSTLTGLDYVLHKLGKTASDVFYGFGELSVSTLEEKVRAAREALEAEQTRMANLDDDLRNGPTARTRQGPRGLEGDNPQEASLKTLRERMAEMNRLGLQARAEVEAAQRNQAQGAADRWKNAVEAALKEIDPLQTEIDNIAAAMTNLVNTASFAKLITEADVERAARIGRVLAARKAAAEEEKRGGGTSVFNAVREARFGESQSLLDEYGQRVAAIRKKYDDLAKAADKAGEDSSKLVEGQIAELTALQNELAKTTREEELAASFDAATASMGDFDRQLAQVREEYERYLRLNESKPQSDKDAQKRIEAAKEAAIQSQALKETQDSLRDATFETAIASLSEYEQAIARINQEYKVWLENHKEVSEEAKRNKLAEATAKGTALTINSARSIAQGVMPEAFGPKGFQDQLEMFQRAMRETPEALARMGISAEDAAKIVERLQTAIETWQTPMQQRIRDFTLEIQAIRAFSIEEQAAVEYQRAYNQTLDQTHDKLLAAADAEMARTKVIEEGQRRLNDALRDARNQGELIGKSPFEQAQIQARQESDLRRQQNGNTGQNDVIDAVKQRQIRDQFLTGPLRQANEDLAAQVRLLEAEKDGFGKTTYEATRLVEAQKMLNEYIAAGVTPATIGVDAWNRLREAVGAYADTAGRVAQNREDFERAKQTFDDIKDTSKDALKGFISDIRAGKSATEALTNALQKLLDKLMDKMFDSVFDGLFGTGKANGNGDIFSFLTGGLMKILRGGGSGGPSIGFGGPANTSGNLTGGGWGGDPYSSAPAIAGTVQKSITSTVTDTLSRVGVGDMARAAAAIKAIESGGGVLGRANYGAIGPWNADHSDRPYGAYQVMGNNVGPWTEKYYGTRLSPEEFRMNTDAQDAVFRGEFGRMADKYGMTGAAQGWIGGEGSIGRYLNRTDVNGTSVGGYGRRFDDLYSRAGSRADLSPANDNLTASTEKLQGSFEDLGRSTDGITPNLTQLGQTMQQQVPNLKTEFASLNTGVGQGGQSVGTALQDTASTVQQSGNSLGNAFSQAIQSVQQAGNSGGGGGLGGLFKGLFGGGGNVSYNIDPLTGAGYHDGGLVGFGATFTRSVDPAMFSRAPRYHAGFRPDEVPAILQQGEWVLSRNDVARIKQGGQGANDNAMNDNGLTVNVINPPSQPKVQKNSDGSLNIMFEEHENWMAERIKRGRGNAAKAVGAAASGQNLIG